jgi:DNA polymerase III delta prime subunit
MPPSKTRQKNNLRAWAGIKSPVKKPVFDGRVLVRIDPTKWKAQLVKRAKQAAAGRLPSKKASKEEPPRDPHPFFHQSFTQKAKKVEPSEDQGGNPLPALASEEDAFRKPHHVFDLFNHISREKHNPQRSGKIDHPSSRENLLDAPWPKRHEMLVQADIADNGTASSSLPTRKRKRPHYENGYNSSFDWDDASGATACVQCNCRGLRSSLFVTSMEDTQRIPASPSDYLTLDSEEALMLSTRYAPKSAKEILHNEAQVACLRYWLQSRRLSSHTRSRLKIDSSNSFGAPGNVLDDWIVDDDDELAASPADSEQTEDDFADRPDTSASAAEIWHSNVLVLAGPSGCGKSAAIKAVCNDLAYEIFEVNPGTKRNQKDIKDAVGEIAQTHLLNKRNDGKSGALCVLLFEEVDILFAEDKDFWHSIYALVATARRPIIMTCNDISFLPGPLQKRQIMLHFEAIPAAKLATYLSGIAREERFSLRSDGSLGLAEACHGDLRAALTQLQLCTDGARESVHQASSPVQGKDETASPYALLRRIAIQAKTASLSDMLLQRTPSRFMEHQAHFELEDEEYLFARGQLKDDLLGYPIVSEPALRYQNLLDGDGEMDMSFAFRQVDAWLPPAMHCALHHDKNDLSNGDAKMVRTACCDILHSGTDFGKEPLSPSIVLRSQSILITALAPFLKMLVVADLQQLQIAHDYIEEHGGRVTRNTLVSVTGVHHARRFSPRQLACSSPLLRLCALYHNKI